MQILSIRTMRLLLIGLMLAAPLTVFSQNNLAINNQSSEVKPNTTITQPNRVIENPSKDSTALQPVAVVNGQSISKTQLDVASAQAINGVTDPAARLRIKNQILNNLINQALVMQQLAKNPAALSTDDQVQIENIKQQAVFNFYIAKQVGEPPRPDKQAIDDYIRKNPNVFEKRRTYHYTQIMAESSDKGLITIKELLQKGASPNDVTAWLAQEKIPYTRNNLWRSTEQISPSTLKALEVMKEGQSDVKLLQDEKLIQVLQLQGSYADPVNIEDARSGIIRGIAQDASNKAARMAIENLRANASIQIIDEALNSSSDLVSSEKQTYSQPISWSAKLIATWVFGLLVFVPACVINLYRRITPPTLEPPINLQSEDALRAAKLPEWMNLYTLRVPFTLILSIILIIPLFNFLLTPPVWLTISKLIGFASIGLLLGTLTVLALYKFKAMNWVWQKKWIPVGILLFVELVIFAIK